MGFSSYFSSTPAAAQSCQLKASHCEWRHPNGDEATSSAIDKLIKSWEATVDKLAASKAHSQVHLFFDHYAEQIQNFQKDVQVSLQTQIIIPLHNAENKHVPLIPIPSLPCHQDQYPLQYSSSLNSSMNPTPSVTPTSETCPIPQVNIIAEAYPSVNMNCLWYLQSMYK